MVDTVWLTQLYVCFWIEVGSRRIHLSGCTYRPSGAWVVQQARNLAWKLQDAELSARFLLCDRDAKFSGAFDEVFRSEGVAVIRLPYRAPRPPCRPADVTPSADGRVQRRDRLGGLLHEYSRAAWRGDAGGGNTTPLLLMRLPCWKPRTSHVAPVLVSKCAP